MPSLRLLAALSILPTALGCSPGGNAASQLLAEPEFAPKGQTKCKVKASQAKPLIVEWPPADRGELEDRMRDGVVVVSYDGCEMRVLSHCQAPVRYSYRPITLKRDRIRIQNEDELWSTIPLGAAKFEGKLATAGELNVRMTMVGRYSADRPLIRQGELTGACDGATHALVGATVGAFEFFAGADAEVGAGVEIARAGVGAGSKASRETLTQDGELTACEDAASKAPPEGCGALLRVEVVALRKGAGESGESAAPIAVALPPNTASDGAVCEAGFFWDGRSCVKRETKVVCPEGSFWEGTSCRPKSQPLPKGTKVAGLDTIEVAGDRIVFKKPVRFFTPGVIEESSLPVLDDVAKLLRANPSWTIEIAGHNDSDGSSGFTYTLSEERAKAVQDHLVSKGVARSRLTVKPYGETKPIAPNDSKQNREKNNRVELTVTKR